MLSNIPFILAYPQRSQERLLQLLFFLRQNRTKVHVFHLAISDIIDPVPTQQKQRFSNETLF